MHRAELNSLIHEAQFAIAQQQLFLEELHEMSADGGHHPLSPWDYRTQKPPQVSSKYVILFLKQTRGNEQGNHSDREPHE